MSGMKRTDAGGVGWLVGWCLTLALIWWIMMWILQRVSAEFGFREIHLWVLSHEPADTEDVKKQAMEGFFLNAWTGKRYTLPLRWHRIWLERHNVNFVSIKQLWEPLPWLQSPQRYCLTLIKLYKIFRGSFNELKEEVEVNVTTDSSPVVCTESSRGERGGHLLPAVIRERPSHQLWRWPTSRSYLS